MRFSVGEAQFALSGAPFRHSAYLTRRFQRWDGVDVWWPRRTHVASCAADDPMVIMLAMRREAYA